MWNTKYKFAIAVIKVEGLPQIVQKNDRLRLPASSLQSQSPSDAQSHHNNQEAETKRAL